MSTDKQSHSLKCHAHSAVGSSVRHTTTRVESKNSAQLQTQAFPATVVRTGRGLTIAGTRTTLYSIMDYLKADWSPESIRDWLDLTGQQITDVMSYIEQHRDEVEAEYEIVLRQAGENRRYWEDQNRQHAASDIALPNRPRPGKAVR